MDASNTIVRGTDAEARQAAADEAYQTYDFGASVDNADGWQYETPGDEWTRVTYLGDEDIPVHFTVRFEPGSATIAEAYAINSSGNIFGSTDAQ